MDRNQKESIVGDLQKELVGVQSIVLADTRGIDVPTVTAVRDAFRAAGCKYQVVKNTMVRIAVEGTPASAMTKLLVGPTAVIWSLDSATAPAKVASKLAKEQEKFKIKGGYFDGQALDASGVEALARMPGKDELRSTLLMTFLAAPTDFVRLMAAPPTNFLYVLQARERALGGE